MPNCRNATIAVRDRHDDRPEIGNGVEDAGRRAPERRLLQPDHRERDPGRHADDDARHDANDEEPGDLVVDLVQDLDGDLLLLQRGPGKLHELAFEQVA